VTVAGRWPTSATSRINRIGVDAPLMYLFLIIQIIVVDFYQQMISELSNEFKIYMFLVGQLMSFKTLFKWSLL